MEEIFKKILDEIDSAIFLIDKFYHILFFNHRAQKFLAKFSYEEKLKCFQIFYNQDFPCKNCPLKYLNEENKKISFNLLSKEEPYLLFEYIYIETNKFLVLVREVRKEIPFWEKFQRILDNLINIVLILKNRKIFYANPSLEKSLGFHPTELKKLDFIETLVLEEERPIVELHYKRALIGIKEEKVLFSLYTKEKKIKNFMWNIFLLREEDLVIFTGIDITEFLQIKTKLEELHKNQTFSNFLKSLVHDFNNILQNTNTYLLKIRESLDCPEKVNEYIDLIERLLSSWIELNKILLDYLKEIKDLKSKYIEIVSFLKENLELFQLIAGEKISLNLDLDYLSSAWIPGDVFLWRYIFLNFITNAKDAIGYEGEIFINLRTVFDEKKALNYLVISIRDTGTGIAPENLKKIFTPFFTTKERGSGLGLFLVNSHIKNLGGFIELESELGKGSTFRIYIPLIEEKSISEKKIKKLSKDRKVKILIVEDEEEIKNFLEILIKQKRYEVISYSNAEEVLQNLDQLKEIDLLVVDLNLKDFSGKKLYEILKEHISDLKVLYLSGDIFSLVEIPEEQILLKPFNIEDFYYKIERLLV
ncbi:MAG: ATP-binding protein [Thermodesulfobacteriaceae bacterium]|nr:ATP-binding protein [Thermodesulfobacteriaceae bacterium]MDW8135197.1 ATP-binding protein [Thermodesulfobacterium sp.]